MTKKAQGAGQFTFGFVWLLTLALKLYEFGLETHWAFWVDLVAQTIVHVDQWVHISVLFFEALATAAVVSIAVTYVVVNNTVNNTTTNKNKMTVNNYSGQELGQVITAIGAQLAEVRDRIAQFEQHLVRTEESERQRMKEFLGFAESEKIKQKDAQLEADQRRLDDIAESLKKVVEVLNRP